MSTNKTRPIHGGYPVPTDDNMSFEEFSAQPKYASLDEHGQRSEYRRYINSPNAPRAR